VFPAMAGSGTRCTGTGDGWATATWPYDASTLRPGGYISGPTQFALADSALWFACFTIVGLEAMAVTTDMTLTFLRPALHGDLHARAKIRSVSRRRILGEIRLWVGDDDGRLVSHAVGSYARPPQ